MPEKTILENVPFVYVWLAILTAMWGGLLSYFRRINQGMKHSIFSAFMHISMSGFAGLMCWLGCVQLGVPGPVTAICTGLAGHMGAEFIKILETRFKGELKKGAR